MRPRLRKEVGRGMKTLAENSLMSAANLVRNPCELPAAEWTHLSVDIDLLVTRWDSEAHVNQSADGPHQWAVLTVTSAEAEACGQVVDTNADHRRLLPEQWEPT